MFLRQSALYTIANVAAALLGFGSVIALTRLVAPSDYGVFVVIMSLGTVLATVTFTWLRHAILRFQSGPDADIRMAALAGYGLTVLLYPAVLLAMLHLFHVPWAQAVIAMMFAAAMALFDLGQEVLRAQQRVKVYVIGSLTRSAASLICCLTAVAFSGSGLTLGLALVSGFVVATLVSSRSVWQRPRKPADIATLMMLARYGLPITVSGLFVALTLALDRFAVFYLVGTDAAGIYGATAEFVRQCAILPAVSACLAIAPLAVATLDRKDATATTQHLADGCELLLAVTLPAAVGLAIAAPQVAGTVFGPEYRGLAAELIPLLAFGFMAHMVSQQYVQLSFSLANRPGQYIWHTGIIFLINFVLMLPLIKLFGVKGAALSLVLSEIAGVIIGLRMARDCYPLPDISVRLVRICAAVAVMAVAAWAMRGWIARTDVLGLVAVVLTGGFAYSISVCVLNVVGARLHALAALKVVCRARSIAPQQV
jgi:O-antigen/teichoic acid export membrane protein